MNVKKLCYETPCTEILEVCFEGVVCQSGYDRSDYGDVVTFPAPAFDDLIF